MPSTYNLYYKKIRKSRLYILVIAILFISQNLLYISCKKFVTIDPPKDQIVSATVYTNDGTATSAIRGIYSQMLSNYGFASGSPNSVTSLSGLSADELTNYSTDPNQTEFYNNSLLATNTTTFSDMWQEPYKYINAANTVIEGLSSSNGVTAATKAELSGEAKFIRAFCYFYLVNLFGDVPLITTTDYHVNSIAARTPKPDVNQQIIADLTDAQTLLSGDFAFSNGERDQPNKWAATALLARAYLYSGDWVNAEIQSTAILDNTATYSLENDLNNVFLANSTEAIWQLKQVPDQEVNTWEGKNFILSSMPYNVAMSTQLVGAFEPGDNRRVNWVDSIIISGTVYYYPYKYKIQDGSALTEYSMVLRLAEQYLIRAEARTQLNNINGAQSDLNAIRNRAGLSNTIISTQPGLLQEILHERQVELFTEWGHRWLDLKRTGTVDSVMSAVTSLKGGSWNSNWQLYPIPQSELINDKNLTQNPGY